MPCVIDRLDRFLLAAEDPPDDHVRDAVGARGRLLGPEPTGFSVGAELFHGFLIEHRARQRGQLARRLED